MSEGARRVIGKWSVVVSALLILLLLCGHAGKLARSRGKRKLLKVLGQSEELTRLVRELFVGKEEELLLEGDGGAFGVRADEEIVARIRSCMSEDMYEENVRVVSEDVDKLQNEEPQQIKLSAIGSEAFYRAFRPYEDYVRRAHFVASQYDNVQYESFGKSAEGRELGALFVGNPSAGAVYIEDGGLHAREWISPAATLYTAEVFAQLLNQSTSQPDILAVFIPMANPDGYVYTQTDRFWRKNRSRNNDTSCLGVDLNRNWKVGFGTGSGGASSLSCSEVYHGEAPLSAPETQALRDLFNRFENQRIKGHLDVHSYGQYVLFPWFHKAKTSNVDERLKVLGRRIATAMTASNNVEFVSGNGAQTLYVANGVISDWVDAQSIPSFVLELRGGSTDTLIGFLLEESSILPAARETCEAMMQLVAFYTADFEPNECTLPTYERSPAASPLSSGVIIAIVTAGCVVLCLGVVGIVVLDQRRKQKIANDALLDEETR